MLDKAIKSFSKRHGYTKNIAEIIIREDAPAYLRRFVINQALKEGIKIELLRDLVCDVLLESSQGNWGYSYIKAEIINYVDACEWYKIYDLSETIYDYLKLNSRNAEHESFAANLNELFYEKGIGWNFQNGKIVIRGDEIEEKVSSMMIDQIDNDLYATAKSEIKEAYLDISRRPLPDLTGCVHHACSALECVARKTTGLENNTFGDILNKVPNLFSKPLDQVAEKLWGYGSQKGRHIKEGVHPTFQEALFVLGSAVALITFLVSSEDQMKLK